MDWQISFFLLFVLFTGGHSITCHECTTVSTSCENSSQCSTGITNCFSATILLVNSSALRVKKCAVANCSSGSANLGIGNISTTCCNTDLCNIKDAPDFSTNNPNGKSCYYCDGKNCSRTVNCSGTEDRCFNATASINGQSSVVKGCASKSICDDPSWIPTAANVTCCEKNLCNSAQSVTWSFLFLGCSLLSFILLH